MKKSILLFAIVSMAFVSCKKEDVTPEPTPLQTNLTAVSVSFAHTGYPTSTGDDGFFFIPDSLVSIPIEGCGIGISPYSRTMYVNQYYSIRYSIAGIGNVYEGDIKFDSNGDLVEVTGNAIGSSHLELKTCNTVIGQQLVVVQ